MNTVSVLFVYCAQRSASLVIYARKSFYSTATWWESVRGYSRDPSDPWPELRRSFAPVRRRWNPDPWIRVASDSGSSSTDETAKTCRETDLKTNVYQKFFTSDHHNFETYSKSELSIGVFSCHIIGLCPDLLTSAFWFTHLAFGDEKNWILLIQTY